MASTEASETKWIITSLLTSTPLRCTIRQLCSDYRNTVGTDIPFKKLGFSSVEEYLRSIPETVHIYGSGPSAEVKGVVTEKSSHINALVAKQRKDSIPAHKKKYIKTFKPINQQPNSSRNRTNLNPHSSSQLEKPQFSYENEYNSKIPKSIQNNLRKLIMQHPEGIWCGKLRATYCKMFKEDLNYEKYNFRSLIELCTDLSDIFHYVQPAADDYMLFDRSRAVPQLNQNDVSEVEEHVSNFEIDWALGTNLIPSDVVQFLYKIPQLTLNDIHIGDHLDINVGEIYNIHKFYVYPKYGQLEQLVDELREFFSINRNRYSIPYLFLLEGLYCVTYYNNTYHRCVIVDSGYIKSDHIKVLFIDYGSVGQVSIKELWYLPVQFATVPCQAMEAKLYNVKPNGDPDHTNRKFEQLINNRELVSEVMEVNDKELVLEIYLADITDGENIFYVNDALVEKGYAQFLSQD